jgi:ADP-ribose pyrophosphatase
VFRGRRIGVEIERWGPFEREIVSHPGAVVVVAVDREGRVALVRQFRPATRSELIELPAGTLEPGEEPLATAQRELREETGLTGGRWREGPAFWTAPGFCRERMYLFFAEDLEQGPPSPDPSESIELVWWSPHELRSRLAEVEDAKTLIGLLLYLDAAPPLSEGR